MASRRRSLCGTARGSCLIQPAPRRADGSGSSAARLRRHPAASARSRSRLLLPGPAHLVLHQSGRCASWERTSVGPIRRRGGVFHGTQPRMERRCATGVWPIARAWLVRAAAIGTGPGRIYLRSFGPQWAGLVIAIVKIPLCHLIVDAREVALDRVEVLVAH